MVIEQLPVQPAPQIEQYTMPEETRGVFTSVLIARKARISLLIAWFMQNYWRYEVVDQTPDALDERAAFAERPMTGMEFANALTESIQPFGIIINHQRVWTWVSERNLPRAENFRVMAEIAEGWQREFALLVIGILKSVEPVEIQEKE